MLALDHIAVACTDLQEGTVWLENQLGVPMGPGGHHAHYATHNRLLGLGDGLYLEIIAKDPAAAPTGRPTWFGLDRFDGPPRLANWICRTDDLSLAADLTGPPVALARDRLRWQITVPDDGSLPMDGAFPTLLKWAQGTTPPGDSLPDSGCRLRALTIYHERADWLRDTLPLADPRVTFRTGPAQLQADISTPDGVRTLSGKRTEN